MAEFSRRELYDRVWKEPMTKVAKEFGLSDRGLAKICERNGIPVPPRGYWAKKGAGKRAPRPPLLEIDGDRRVETIGVNRYRPPFQPSNADETVPTTPKPKPYKEMMEDVLKELKPLNVPATLRNPHSLIARWLEADRRDRELWDHVGRHGYRSPDTPPMEKCRLRVLSALFKALEAHGFTAEQGTYRRDLWVRIGQDKVLLSVEERIRQRRYKLSDKEKAERRTSQVWTQTREPTGELVLKIKSATPDGVPGEWHDEDDAKLETKLHVAVAAFIATVAYAGACREREAERAHQRYLDEMERRKQEELRQAEVARKKVLRIHAKSWRMAADLRAYIAAIEDAARNGDVNAPEEETVQWLEWAKTHADELDPLTNGQALSAELSATERAMREIPKLQYSAYGAVQYLLMD